MNEFSIIFVKNPRITVMYDSHRVAQIKSFSKNFKFKNKILRTENKLKIVIFPFFQIHYLDLDAYDLVQVQNFCQKNFQLFQSLFV